MALEQDEKVRENRLRRAATRQGIQLSRSRTRDPRALTFGCYTLTRIVTGEQIGGGCMDLVEVEKHLSS